MRTFPGKLQKLYELALDLRRSSSFHAEEFWKAVDPNLWEQTHNPWLILHVISDERLKELEKDSHFHQLLKKHLQTRTEFHEASNWFEKKHSEKKLKHIAYFSMEFGLSESLPIYSGGLGMLAGDHLKTCSDLKIPLTGIGLLYQQGYFRQVINIDGEQKEFYPFNEPYQLPIERAADPSGKKIRLQLRLPGRDLWLRVWRVRVGLVSLYLLDTNSMLNTPHDRGITGELYGGKKEMRLQQEFVLGIGGWRLLECLGIHPEVCHLNEGHAAFAIFERARSYANKQKVSFFDALEKTRKGNLFTTHTPVEAGFDRFDRKLFIHHFERYAKECNVAIKDLLALGQLKKTDPFNMAYFAVRGSQATNAVSQLHGEVSKKLFAPLFPEKKEIPVGFVTNGIHVPSWESAESDLLWSRSCGAHRWMSNLKTTSEDLSKNTPKQLWDLRCKNRSDLITYVRDRYAKQCRISGMTKEEVSKIENILNPDILTIGFARRFATYKRPNLLLHDPDRLISLLSKKERPIQLIIAGKAHPQDKPAKKMIQEWQTFLKNPQVVNRIIFLSDYDILLAEHLVQGIDLWLNTPRRPFEASGTSGMKILVNGGLNLSELDGWWAEAYSPQVGWALGDGKEHGEIAQYDAEEAENLYQLLEKEVIPAFYDRDSENLPTKWLAKMKSSMLELSLRFSSNRMVREYVEKYYLPLATGCTRPG